jgi:DNA helicase-2/ATP-dependent DNA helicase PcrA
VIGAGFTPAQLEAIGAPDGPICVIAGPGCGKTTLLAARIAFLVEQRGYDPASILAVSFTTAAARALRAQLDLQIGSVAAEIAIHTLHALGRRVVDTWAGQLGFHNRPAVLHPGERRALLESTAVELGWGADTFIAADLQAAVDRCRLIADPQAQAADPVWPLATAYEDRLRCHGALDFVGMLALPLRLFQTQPESLQLLQTSYRCVLADEAQDLTESQWVLLELLAAEHRHLMVVGDPAQAIFSWLGADPRQLVNFADLYPDAQTVNLDVSHRATRNLVELANALSDLLAYRPGLVTYNPEGPSARLTCAEDEQAEAALIARQIGSLVDRGLIDHPGHAAVLYRTRGHLDILVSALRAEGVPYTMAGHGDLFTQRVVRDVLAYVRLASNPNDRPALIRALEAPPRDLGRLAATLAVADEPIALGELPGLAQDLYQGPAAIAAVADLVSTVYELHAEAVRGRSPVDILDRALERSGYRAWLERRPDSAERLRTLGRLRAVAARSDLSLGAWLDAIAVGDDVESIDAAEESTHLSSIHAAKGREFRAVFLPALEESELPHYRALDGRDGKPDDDALEAELRLLYVGLTRPRERLFLSYCRRRSRDGRAEFRQPSRWLYALPPDLLAATSSNVF